MTFLLFLNFTSYFMKTVAWIRIFVVHHGPVMRISIFSAVRLHDDSAYVLHAHYLGDVPNKHYILAGYDKETRYISTEKKKMEFYKFRSTLTYTFFFFLSSKS